MYKKIYQFLRKIPKGKVISYKALADFFCTSPRAIGKIMNGNNDPDRFPCYKVVKKNGEIGGYHGNETETIKEKVKKLTADGIQIIKGKIPEKYFWHPTQLKTKTKGL